MFKKAKPKYHVEAKEVTYTTYRDVIRHILMIRDWLAENGLDDTALRVPAEVHMRPGDTIRLSPALDTDDPEIATLYKLRFG